MPFRIAFHDANERIDVVPDSVLDGASAPEELLGRVVGGFGEGTAPCGIGWSTSAPSRAAPDDDLGRPVSDLEALELARSRVRSKDGGATEDAGVLEGLDGGDNELVEETAVSWDGPDGVRSVRAIEGAFVLGGARDEATSSSAIASPHWGCTTPTIAGASGQLAVSACGASLRDRNRASERSFESGHRYLCVQEGRQIACEER